MRVVYTEDALRDLGAIADWLILHYPTVAPAVERRIRAVVAHITIEILHIHHAARQSWDAPNSQA